MHHPKILYTSFDQVPAPKGASTHILAFAKALANRYAEMPACGGWPNVVLATAGQADLGPKLLAPGLTQLVFGCPDDNPIGRALTFRAKLANLLRQQPFEAIHFRSPFEGLVAIDPSLNRGAKLIYEVNGLPSVEMKFRYPQLQQNARLHEKLQQQERACLEAADRIITVSRVNAACLERCFGRKCESVVIPNGFDPAVFHPAQGVKRRTDPSEILYFGTWSPWQGLEVLLESLAIVNQFQKCRLIIAGPATRNRRREIGERISSLALGENVSIHENLPQSAICQLLHVATLSVIPLLAVDRNTQQGCCPIKLIESLGAGCPVVASDLPVVNELVNPGEHFWPCPPGDPQKLAEAILEALNQPERAAEMARQALDYVNRELTWAQAGQRLLDLYRSLGGNFAAAAPAFN